MSLLLALVAFAWFMALNLFILIFQQHNVALMAHVRNTYPAIYEQIKNRLSFSLFSGDKQTRHLLGTVGEAELLNDPLVKGVLNELAGIRQRGLRTMVLLTLLLVIVLVLTFR